MSVYTKLNSARAAFHLLDLKKTGLNKFAGYKYFELGDFLIPALKVMADNGLCAFISFGTDLATMTIVDVTPKPFDGSTESITITSPMSSAALKGCHEVQNLGAVQTYLRRYLWVAALEIVEHDAIDSGEPIVKKTPTTIIPALPKVELSDKRQSVVIDVAEAIKERYAADDMIGAFDEYQGITDGEEKIALWGLLPSNIRSAIKKHNESLKG